MASTEENRLMNGIPTLEDTQCGFWIFKAQWMQKLASKKTFVALLGLSSCFYTAQYLYLTGTLTTMEKRFRIPSQQSGMLTVGSDLVQLIPAIGISYVAAKGHRPRWIALGVLIQSISCLVTALPHFIYGPGEDAILLTKEYALSNISQLTPTVKDTCEKELPTDVCTTDYGSWGPIAWIFIGITISGLGGPLYFQLVTTYMDDNIKKSKVPIYLSISSFIRMIGPSLGLYLSSLLLKYFIDPSLTPVVDDKDPRWVGAWWIGWLIFFGFFLVSAFLFSLFPKTLPRAAERKQRLLEQIRQGKRDKSELKPIEKASWHDMKVTIRRILTNKTYMFNTMSGVFYCFGYLPFWMYQTKYIEVQYRVSASTANMTTGTISMVFTSLGILLSGIIITKYKPKARSLALWNVFIGWLSVAGIIAYTFNGCANNDNPLVLENSRPQLCNTDCNCDFVKYTPICGINNRTYISPCHAGCTESETLANGTKIYFDCACIADTVGNTTTTFATTATITETPDAVTGLCPVDCTYELYMFFIILCINNFISGTEASTNFLLAIRCVDQRDKTVSLGISGVFISLLALIPSPIFFGTLIDSTCVLWGKTCGKNGNCWLYDAEKLKYRINFLVAAFIAVATLLDIGTWYYSKHVKIFDEDESEKKDGDDGDESDCETEMKFLNSK